MIELKDLSYGPYGDRNHIDLFLPDQPTRPVPLVLFIHGGGWRRGDKSEFEWMAKTLIKEGFAVASINYRFWPESVFPAAVDDAFKAVRWLRSRAEEFCIDPTRIGAIGSSAGSHLAAFLALNPSHPCPDSELEEFAGGIQCVIDCYGPVDLVWMMQSASAEIVEGFMGKPLNADTAMDYLNASPAAMVGPNPPPFLIVHGSLDIGEKLGQVPIGIARQLADKLRVSGGNADLVVLEGAPHGFLINPESPFAQKSLELAVPFLRKHLTGDKSKR